MQNGRRVERRPFSSVPRLTPERFTFSPRASATLRLTAFFTARRLTAFFATSRLTAFFTARRLTAFFATLRLTAFFTTRRLIAFFVAFA